MRGWAAFVAVEAVGLLAVVGLVLLLDVGFVGAALIGVIGGAIALTAAQVAREWVR